MGFLALLLVVSAAWMVATGRLRRLTTIDGAMLGLAIVGAIMAARGRPLIGGVPLLITALYGFRRFFSSRTASPVGATGAPGDQAVRDARALLGVEEDADEEAVRAAHRRLIAKIHPDAGGTQALAEKINDARALLLRHISENKGSHPTSSSQ